MSGERGQTFLEVAGELEEEAEILDGFVGAERHAGGLRDLAERFRYRALRYRRRHAGGLDPEAQAWQQCKDEGLLISARLGIPTSTAIRIHEERDRRDRQR